MTKSLAALMGLDGNNTGHLEKWVSAAGGFCGILAVVLISRAWLDITGAAWVVASMGASAVLLFAVPHGPLSQPWPVLGGHLVSAVIGVACAKLVPDTLLAAALSVALAIGAMHYLRCIHPPGGATALTAVVGGEGLHALGFGYVLTPVLLNAATILLIAVLFNYGFPWRRYPTALARHGKDMTASTAQPGEEGDTLTRRDLEIALKSLNRVVDISNEDLEQIYHLARRSAQASGLAPEEILPGHYYCNGQYGPFWQVRQVIDTAGPVDSADDLLIYKVVAGRDRRSTATVTLGEFSRWARYEVFLNENSWQRVDPASLDLDRA